MTSLLFCLIFLQVTIFFIAGLLLVSTLYFGWKDKEPEPIRTLKFGRGIGRRGFASRSMSMQVAAELMDS